MNSNQLYFTIAVFSVQVATGNPTGNKSMHDSLVLRIFRRSTGLAHFLDEWFFGDLELRILFANFAVHGLIRLVLRVVQGIGSFILLDLLLDQKVAMVRQVWFSLSSIYPCVGRRVF